MDLPQVQNGLYVAEQAAAARCPSQGALRLACGGTELHVKRAEVVRAAYPHERSQLVPNRIETFSAHDDHKHDEFLNTPDTGL